MTERWLRHLPLRAPGRVEPWLSEETFLSMLRMERGRSERSGKPFLLMLAEVDCSGENGSAWKSLQEVGSALQRIKRETDLVGWHVENSVFGVIFTEIGAEKERIVDVVRAKMEAGLRTHVRPELARRVRLTFHVFPDDWHKKNPSENMRRELYLDLPRAKESRATFHVVKRFLDIVGSLSALVVSAPLFFFVAAMIKLTSKGPVFFRQERLGRYAIPFQCLKFRTMHVDNDPTVHRQFVEKFIAGRAKGNGNKNGKEAAVFKITDDPRVTRIGRFLRKTSLDEFPQFWNVLKGEMSLVGPRPPIAYELEVYDIWHRRRVLEAKPGITGLWQVEGRSRTTFDEMVRLDLRYSNTQSLKQDLRILLKTPWAVFSSNGAY